MLRLRGISKVYRHGLVETVALADVSVDIARGEFVAIMGPSGSGKTTMLNVMGLLDAFEEGQYLIEGVDVHGMPDAELARVRNRHLGFVFQGFNLLPDLDVFDNVDVPLRYRGLARRDRRDRVEAVLAKVGLTARLHHLPGQLSGGQQQRVAIARALVTEPSLILADEPTGNLDSITARQIVDLFEQINAGGTTVVLVTHDHELAARAGRRLHMLDGRLIDPHARASLPSVPLSPGRSLTMRVARDEDEVP